MLINFAYLLVIPGVLCVPIENYDAADVIAVSPDSERLIDAPRTLNFDKLHTFNPIYWFTDDDDISELEKRQRVLYDLITCGNPTSDRCKKIAKLAAKLFKKTMPSDVDDEDDDKPESKPENKPQKPAENSEKPTKKPGKPENSEEKPATVKPEENKPTSTDASVTTMAV